MKIKSRQYVERCSTKVAVVPPPTWISLEGVEGRARKESGIKICFSGSVDLPDQRECGTKT